MIALNFKTGVYYYMEQGSSTIYQNKKGPANDVVVNVEEFIKSMKKEKQTL